jgi:chromosomal replication initiation ATPase DnaA
MAKIEDIQKIAAEYFEVSLISMRGRARRGANQFACPRMIAMALCREMTQRSLQEIGQQFGHRDHTTVLHAIARVNASRFLRDNADRVKAIIVENPLPNRAVTWLVRTDKLEVRP